MSVILLDDVSRTYHRGPETIRATREVSWELPMGELAVITGSSGSGKTTLLNLIVGIEAPDSGTVTILGEELSALSESARAEFRLENIGVVFQDHNLITEFTAVENVELPLVLRGMDQADARASAVQALDTVGLREATTARPEQLSGGQRQRVGLARALAGGQRLIVADEPTGSVDAATARDIFGRFRELAESGLSVVLVTHDQRATAYGHRVHVMEDGLLSEDAS